MKIKQFVVIKQGLGKSRELGAVNRTCFGVQVIKFKANGEIQAES